jgi:hypothetical protein
VRMAKKAAKNAIMKVRKDETRANPAPGPM